MFHVVVSNKESFDTLSTYFCKMWFDQYALSSIVVFHNFPISYFKLVLYECPAVKCFCVFWQQIKCDLNYFSYDTPDAELGEYTWLKHSEKFS
jgi:hypothetical protein